MPIYDKVTVNIKVLKLFKPEQIGMDKKTKRDVSIADTTAIGKLVLWENHIDDLQEGKCYQLQNFYVKEFHSKRHLSMPKQDYLILPIDDFETIDTDPPDDEYTTITNVCILLQVLSALQGLCGAFDSSTGKMYQVRLSNDTAIRIMQ